MQWLRSTLELFYPPLCCGCDAHLEQRSDILCTSCRFLLPYLPIATSELNEIKRKFFGKLDVKHCASVLTFGDNSITQNMLHQLKYQKQKDVSRYIGSLAWHRMKDQSIFDWAECIVPIPLHPSKERLRGYNQLDGFGMFLSEMSGIPYLKDYLIKTLKSDTQTQKNLVERADNIKGFVLNPKYLNSKERRVLLIDDVITTGATLEAAGKCVLEKENNQISVLTMAYVK